MEASSGPRVGVDSREERSWRLRRGGGGGGGGGAGRGAARAASALGWSFFGPVSANESFAGNHSPGSEGGFADLLLLALFRVARFFRRAAAALSAAIVAALPSTFQTTLVKPVVDGALLLSGVWLLRGLFEVTWRLGSIALLSLLPALGAMTLLSSANAPRQPHTAPFPAHQRAPPFASAPPPPPPSPPTQNRNWSPTSGFERSPNRFASTGADYRAYGDNASWSEFDGYTAGEGVGRRSGRYERWEEVRDEDLGLGYAPRRGTASSPNLAAAEISTWEEVSDEDLGLGYAPRRGTASSPNAAGTATGTVPGTDLAGLENAPERRSPAGGSENAAAAGASAVGASAGSASAATAGWASNVHSSGRPAGAPAHDAGSRPVRGEAGGPAGLGVSAHGAGSRPVRGNAGGSAGLGTPGHSVEGKSSAAGSSRRGGVVSRVVDGSGSRGMRVYECCNGTCTCAACVTPAFLQTAPGRGRAVGSVPAVDRAEQGVGAAAADMKAWDEAVVSAAPPPAAATTWDEAVPTVVATAASAPSAPFTASTAPSIIVGNHEVASGSRASGNYFPPVLNPVAPVLNPVAVSDATARLEAIRSDLKRHVAAEAAFSAPAPASAPASAVPSAVARVAFGSAAREAAFRPPPAAAAAPFASSDPVFVDNGEGRVDTQSERKPLVGLGKNSLLIADDLNVGDLNEGDDFIPLHDLHREDDLTREDDLNLNAVFLENFCEWPRRRVAVAAAAVDSRPDREGPLPVRGAAVVGRRRAVTHTDGVQPGEGRWHAQAVESMPDREGPLPVRRAAVARRRMAVTHTDGVQPGEGRWHTQPSLQSSPGGGIGERAALGGAEGRLGGYGRREELTGKHPGSREGGPSRFQG
ncbi:hypothetical protein CLOM_g11869 [Closterium sp. NIES-68]|nr:hypothetical protein CLOM_g11869 [Closterium sp. NIES-68]